MLQITIIGLSTFGKRMIDELYAVGAELILIDRNAVVIDQYKAKAKACYVVDVANVKDSLEKLIPQTIDAAILDFDDKLEPSILMTHFLHQMGIKNIIVETQSDTHAELLELAGATRIVYPELEAAKNITPQLLSKKLSNYIQLSNDFAIAEIEISKELEGKTLKDSNFRSEFNLNVVACRISGEEELKALSDPNFVFTKDCNVVVAGTNEAINKYVNKHSPNSSYSEKSYLTRFFKK